MNIRYRARWISKAKADAVKRSGLQGKAILLDHMKGFIIVEPPGSHMGDGPALSNEVAEFELTSVWCLASRNKVAEARKLLGIDASEPADVVATI